MIRVDWDPSFNEMGRGYPVSDYGGRRVESWCDWKSGARGLVELTTFNPKHTRPMLHQTVDDRPYGGGPGMLMKVETLRPRLLTLGKTDRGTCGLLKSTR